MAEMEQMKVVRPIYIRSGPGRGHRKLATVYPSGQDIIFDGVEIGESWKGISEWYFKLNEKDEKQYYWKGGLEKTEKDLPWGIRALGIDQLWIKTTGEEVKIAIIDTGIDLQNEDLSPAIFAGFNLLTGEDFNDVPDCIQDADGHGTACATVIAAQGQKQIKGIAPGCKLIIIKIAEFKTENNDFARLAPLAIERAIAFGADIVSMSFGFSINDQNVQNCIQQYWDNHVFVAAAGNSRAGVDYPANIPGMISVGAMTVDNASAGYRAGRYDIGILSAMGVRDNNNEGITLVAPGEKIPVYDLRQLRVFVAGTSFAAPFVAAVIALLISLKYKGTGKSFSQADIHEALADHTYQKPDISLVNLWGNGIIDPVSLIS